MRLIIPTLCFALIATPADAFVFLAPLLSAIPSIGTFAQVGIGILSAGAAVFQGIAAKQNAEAQAAREELNARLEETNGLQRDTIAREELAATLGSIRAARGGRGLTSPTALSFLQEADERLSSDRTVELLNSRQRAADRRQSARQLRRQGRISLISGVSQAGLSLFETGSYFSSRRSFSKSSGAVRKG